MAIAFIGINIYFYTVVLMYLQITADGAKTYRHSWHTHRLLKLAIEVNT